jgi:hypothetical protein
MLPLAAGLLLTAASGCKNPTDGTTLVGVYSIKGVLTENSCGQTALPVPNPLEYQVEIREQDGIGYWVPTKQAQNIGSLNAQGQFRFALTQTQVYGDAMLAPPIDQPSDFFPASNGMNDPDLQRQNQTACALTLRQTVSGTLQRRNAADGGGIVELAAGESGSDLSADNVIDVSPSAGSQCMNALTAFGGTFTSLPCSARYVMEGSLAGATNSSGASSATAGGAGASAGRGGTGTAGASGTGGAAPSAPITGAAGSATPSSTPGAAGAAP